MTKPPLKVGILLDDFDVPIWAYQMIENIQASDYAQISLVILNTHEKLEENKTLTQKVMRNKGRIGYLAIRKVLEVTYDKLIERRTYLSDSEEIKNCAALLQNATTLKVKTDRKKWSDYFSDQDLQAVSSHSPDILIRCGFGILRGGILNVAKHGIWSFHHGDNRVNRGGPAGFWESMEGWSETGSILQILSEDLDNGKVLYRSYSSTHTLSVSDNKSNYDWKTLSFIPRKLEELHRTGADKFFAKVEHENRHPEFYSNRLYTQPTNFELAKLTLSKLKEKVALLYKNKFVFEQWILMFHLNEEFSSSLWRYKQIIPPDDRFWADPHVIQRDDKYYIYVEEYMYNTALGHISLIIMDSEGNHSEPETIISKDYHLSYPFVFEYEGKDYMIPESMDNRTVDLYECTDFPKKWELKKTIMKDVSAVDATLFEHNGKWWMFANVVEHPGVSSFDELYIYSADSPLSDDWQAHPMNPVISDCKLARPAGKIFVENGRIYRPSQNCSKRYGYGFNISEIITLDEENYSEELVSAVKPDWDKKIVATHTFNREGNLHIIDAMRQRKRVIPHV